MEPDPCRKLGPRHRMPALSGAEREGGNFKEETMSEAGKQPGLAESGPYLEIGPLQM